MKPSREMILVPFLKGENPGRRLTRPMERTAAIRPTSAAPRGDTVASISVTRMILIKPGSFGSCPTNLTEEFRLADRARAAVESGTGEGTDASRVRR